jgi:hypothetical protein
VHSIVGTPSAITHSSPDRTLQYSRSVFLPGWKTYLHHYHPDGKTLDVNIKKVEDQGPTFFYSAGQEMQTFCIF